MGRPCRQLDTDFAEKLDVMVRRAGSVRRAALALGVAPTTLARSLEEQSFARVTKDRIAARMAAAEAELVAPRVRMKRTSTRISEVAQILEKLFRLLPAAIAELEVVEATLESPPERGSGQQK